MQTRNILQAEQFIFKVAAVPSQAFTAAVTDIITSAAHGLSNGDCLQFTTSNTLPAGLSLATNYYVINVTTDTFQVCADPGIPTAVDITDTGTGTHTYHLKGRKIYAGDWSNIELNIATANSANMTVKVQTSDQDDVDFNAAQSSTNRWDYMQLKLLTDNTTYNGVTGIVASGSDIYKQYEVNMNGKKWLTAIITSYTAGNLNLTAKGYGLI